MWINNHVGNDATLMEEAEMEISFNFEVLLGSCYK